MFDWLTRWFRGKPEEKPEPDHRPRSRYDSARSTRDNRRDWAGADALSAKAQNNPGVRTTLRNRSRYEAENNGYMSGLVQTLADDAVGVGPTLRLQTPDPAVNDRVEQAWCSWACKLRNGPAGGLAETLHLCKQAKVRCGEIFGLLDTDEAIDHPVKLDFRLIEADQVGPPTVFPDASNPGIFDGIELDDRGRPAYYHVYKVHPGDMTSNLSALPFETVRVPARNVIHWFKIKRPGQLRGVPEVTPSLNLFPKHRRWNEATLVAAETAADFAGVVETPETMVPGDDPDADADNWDEIEIEKGTLTRLPPGAKLNQMTPEHPGQAHDVYKHELLKEQGRPVSAPYCVIAGDSSVYNLSSVRLDHGLYRGSVKVDRKWGEGAVLEPLYRAFMAEAVLVTAEDGLPLIPPGVDAYTPHVWDWPGFASIDPLKEAQADAIELANCTSTLAEKLAEKGQDWEKVIRQRAAEVKLMRELGLEVPGAAPAGQPQGEPQPPQDDGPPPEQPKPRPPKRGIWNDIEWIDRHNGSARP